jgi:allophanate hydrolase
MNRGLSLLKSVQSAPEYKFYALPGGPPFRPGMVRCNKDGGSIALEIWEMSASEFGTFVAGIPAPLGIGMIKLDDGSYVQGFVCESAVTEGAQDITETGGWRNFLANPKGVKNL